MTIIVYKTCAKFSKHSGPFIILLSRILVIRGSLVSDCGGFFGGITNFVT